VSTVASEHGGDSHGDKCRYPSRGAATQMASHHDGNESTRICRANAAVAASARNWRARAMQTIVVASRKGGSGKSMLTRHIAVEIERIGAGRVAMVDADPMQGLTGWWQARAAGSPLLIDIAEGLPAAVATARRLPADVLLIDTPPSNGDIVAESVALADIVVIPVQPSPDDLRAVGSTVALAKRLRKRLVFVVNRVKPRARLTGQAAIVLSQHGTVCPVMVADRTVYAASGTDGRTAPEMDPAAAAEIAGLWRYLADCMAEVAV